MEKLEGDNQTRPVSPAQEVKVYGPGRGGRVSRDTGVITIATLLCLPSKQRHGGDSQEDKASCGESGVDLT